MGYQFNTDFSTIEPSDGANGPGSTFPLSDTRGWLCQMVYSEPRENSKKTGMVLDVKLQGMEGAVNGKLHEYSINLSNPNQQAVEIGQRECSAIAHVTGHTRIGNSVEWHNKPFRVVIGPEMDKTTKEPTGRMEIKKYLDVNGNGPKDAGKGVMGAPIAQQTAQGFQQNAAGQQPAAGGWGNGGVTGGTPQSSGQGFQQGGGFQPSNNGQTAQMNASPSDQQFSNGQTGQPNAQGGVVNPGSTFQPTNQQVDPNQGQQGGFQQNPGAFQQGAAAPGGWNR